MDTLNSSRRLDFVLHQNLLRHIVGRQAPSLAKAVLEAVMNAADGGAGCICIELGPHRLVIQDDGQGLGADLDDIRRIFGTFGEPHDTDDVPFGEFRMGRGQLFAQGRTRYISGPFRITVDLSQGYHWEVEDVPFSPGCRIEVDLEREADVMATKEEVAILAGFMPLPVIINGEQVNELPGQVGTWDMETDDAWFRIGRGPLRLYNRGAHVRDYPAETWGLGGTVVSKTRLKVTFGRNEVMRDCPAFARIVSQLDDAFLAALGARRGTTLPETMRARVLALFCRGRIPPTLNIMRFRLLKDARSSFITLPALCRYIAVCAGPLGDAHAWRAIKSGRSMVLCRQDIEDLGIDLTRLLASLRRLGPAPVQVTWEQVKAEVQLGRNALHEEKLDPHSRAILFGTQVASRAIAMLLERTGIFGGPVPIRRVTAADEGSEDYWSDGESYIAISRRLLDQVARGKHSFTTAVGWLAFCYLRYPDPGSCGIEDEMQSAHIISMANNALASLLTSSIEEESIPRSSLKGDPHTFGTYWSQYVSVRDLGDVARAMAEDYGRRCPGLGVQPKPSLLLAAGISLAKTAIGQDVPNNAIEWIAAALPQFRSTLKEFALDHWVLEGKGFQILAKRGAPKLLHHTARYSFSIVRGLLGSSFSPFTTIVERWLEEPLPLMPIELHLAFLIGSKKRLRLLQEVRTDLLSALIRAEVSLGRLHADHALGRDGSGTNNDKVLNAVLSQRRQKVLSARIPSCTVLHGANESLDFVVTASHGPRPAGWSPPAWRRRHDPYTCCSNVRIRPAHIREIGGWPVLTKLLRRHALAAAGRQALTLVNTKEHITFLGTP